MSEKLNGIGIMFVDGYPSMAKLDTRGVAQGVVCDSAAKVDLITEMIKELERIVPKTAGQWHQSLEHLSAAKLELEAASEKLKEIPA